MSEKERFDKLLKKRDELRAKIKKVETESECYEGILKEAEKCKYNILDFRIIENKATISKILEKNEDKKRMLDILRLVATELVKLYSEEK